MNYSTVKAEELPLPELNACHTSTVPLIDGVVKDEEWPSASRTTDFVEYKTGLTVKEKTCAYFMYDEKNIYIAFKCMESQMDKLIAKTTEENGTVFYDDCVEVFLCPSFFVSDRNYYHFAVNAKGTKFARYGNVAREGSLHGLTWDAKAYIGKDYWTVEMKIPLESMKVRAQPIPYWRINFGREELPSKEISSWSPTYGSFHNAERYGKLMGLDKLVNSNCAGKPVFIKPVEVPQAGTGDGIITTDMPDAYTPPIASTEVVIIPKPVSMVFAEGKFSLTPETVIAIKDGFQPEDKYGAAELVEEVKSVTGYDLKVVTYKDLGYNGAGTNAIVLGEPGADKIVNGLAKKNGIVFNKKVLKPEGYLLKVSPGNVFVLGMDKRGTYYGVQSLKQLVNRTKKIPGVLITDYPAMPYRGIHVLVDKHSLVTHGKMIDKLFALYKINNLTFECEQGIKWDSCPTLADPQSASKEDIKKLISYANKHFITVTPLVQTLGHLEYVFRKDKKNMEFCEDPNSPYAYCPMNPKSYEWAFGMIDEAIELFGNPEHFHIGHDEHNMRGDFPNPAHKECTKLGNLELYFRDTLKIIDYVKSKGVKHPVMWGDVLLKPDFRPYIKRIPKNVIIADWHYDSVKKFESVDFFKSKGYQVLACTWYSWGNIQNFVYYGMDRNILGLLHTTWAGYFNNNDIVQRAFDQVEAYILAAEFAWAGRNNSLKDLGYNVDEVLIQQWREDKLPEETKKGFTVDISRLCNLSFVDTEQRFGWIGEGYLRDMSSLPTGRLRLRDGITYYILDTGKNGATAVALYAQDVASEFPEKVFIPVQKKAVRLYFLHSFIYGVKKKTVIGEYNIRYEDGTAKNVKLIHGVNIDTWLTDLAGYDTMLAWEGKTKGEERITLRSYAWNNPEPEKVIKEIVFTSANTPAMPVLLAITGLE
ncbi:MAG: carbohydrate-binding family 9-like protein [Elusimicrobiota bacterium]